MSATRTGRNEAWITSLLLHVGLLAGIVAVIGRPREQSVGPIVVNTRANGHEIGVVLLDAPAKPTPPAVLPPSVVKTVTIPVAPPPAPVTPAAHHQNPPVAHAPGSPAAPVAPVAAPGPVAHAPGSPSQESPTKPGPPLPPGAATTFFGVPAIGKSVVFVLDRSASMGLDGRLDRARRELDESLRQLPPSARFQVIAYNRVAEPLRLPGTNGLVPATPDAVAAAVTAVGTLTAEGGSDHLRALTTALALGPDVVYFLTDEDDLESRDVGTVTRRNGGRVCIHTLCLVSSGSGMPMADLARQNRGQFQVVR